MTKISVFATHGPTGVLGPVTFDARPVGDHDVRIAIPYCSVCHSVKGVEDGAGGNLVAVPGVTEGRRRAGVGGELAADDDIMVAVSPSGVRMPLLG